MYVHKTMVIVIHALVDLSEVNNESKFVRVRLFHGKNWAVVRARIDFSDYSQTEEFVYLLILNVRCAAGMGNYLTFHNHGFLHVRAENVGYSVRFPHIEFRFCYCFMLHVKCCTEMVSLFYG